MTEAPVPDAAVQIGREAIYAAAVDDPRSTAAIVVEALARAGWLHDPAELDPRRAAVLAKAETAAEVARKYITRSVSEVDLYEAVRAWRGARHAEPVSEES